MDAVRVDKYLWSIRAYKTRSDATVACRGGKVRVNGADAKPSKEVKVGDMIAVRKGPATFTYKVTELVQKRQGARNVAAFAENLTPQSELAKLTRPVETVSFRRDPGTGRPTKKDRRQLDALVAGMDDGRAYPPSETDRRFASGPERRDRAAYDPMDEDGMNEAWLEALEDELAELDENLESYLDDEY